MLRYLGLGERQLGDFPMPPHTRVNWEFMGVVRGTLAPVFEGARDLPPVADTLWLFPPGFVHGWTGEARRTCEIVVIHFSAVPGVLEQVVSEYGHLSAKLSASDKRLLLRLGQTLKPHYWHPVLVSEIHCERALMDLSLIVMRGVKESREPHQAGVSLSKVLDAENWFKRHLEAHPSIEDAAKAVGTSPSQLRRSFRKVRKIKPKQLLNKIRFDKAMHLMAESDAKLERIAVESGFSNATNFCRAFKAFVGKSPTAWRREIYIQYKKPRDTEKTEYWQHGRRYREL